MSTEHQKYSTENQASIIRQYAKDRGFEIVRTYADQGKSGLNLGGRDALQQLLDDVQGGAADFEAVLVYDVSRWGRFQDADESAFHEYICKRAGVSVHFCAEQFDNDGGLAATMIKGMKRVMAGEYSRELSVKVFMGQCRLVELGFRQGGTAGFGLRRLLVDEHRNPKIELARGEHKNIQTDRVILMPGPESEVATVRRIYSMYLGDNRYLVDIAKILNTEGVLAEGGVPWTASRVRGVLANEKYVGDNVFNRRSYKLKQRRVVNPASMWVRAEGAFPALVEREKFEAIRSLLEARRARLSNDEMLNALRDLFEQHGRLRAIIIDETPGLPSSAAYRHRFGSLGQAYRLSGVTSLRDDAYVAINRTLRALHPTIVAQTIEEIERGGAKVARRTRDGSFTINGELAVSVNIVRCIETVRGSLRWVARLDVNDSIDLTIIVRMDSGNNTIKDYYFLPKIEIIGAQMRFQEDNGSFLDAFRFDNLDYLVAMTARSALRKVA